MSPTEDHFGINCFFFLQFLICSLYVDAVYVRMRSESEGAVRERGKKEIKCLEFCLWLCGEP